MPDTLVCANCGNQISNILDKSLHVYQQGARYAHNNGGVVRCDGINYASNPDEFHKKPWADPVNKSKSFKSLYEKLSS